MTYRAGIGESMRALGFKPQLPHVQCDWCGCTHLAVRVNGQPYAWLLRGKGPPKWLLVSSDGGYERKDYCPACKKVKP